MSDPIQVPVPEVVQKATKAVTATVIATTGVLTLFGTSISDGVLTWQETGTLIGAVVTAISIVTGVWRVPNEVVSVTMRQPDFKIN